MLNDKLVLSQAKQLADRLRDHSDTLARQLERAYEILFGRQPRAAEADLLVPFARDHGLEKLCLLLLNSNEFMFVD